MSATPSWKPSVLSTFGSNVPASVNIAQRGGGGVRKSARTGEAANVASFSPAFKQEPRRRKISRFDEIVGALEHGGQFVPVQLPGHEVEYRPVRG